MRNNQKALLHNKKSNFDNKSALPESLTEASTTTISPGSKVEGDQNSLESPNSPRPTFESEPLKNKEEKSSELSQNLYSPTTSRQIPAHQKRLALSQINNHCTYPNCNKPAEIFHHPDRYSKTKNHNNIKPLCKIHHEFMHNSIVENEEKNAEKWELNLNKVKNKIDNLYQEYRQKALT